MEKKHLSKEYIGIDAAIQHNIKPVGVWQLTVIFLGVLSMVSFEEVSIFNHADPFKRCKMEPEIEELFKNLSVRKVNEIIQPSQLDQTLEKGCYRLTLNWTEIKFSQIISISKNYTKIENCPFGYIQEPDPAQMANSMTEDFELFCGSRWVESFTMTSMMAGMFVGFYLSGYFGDRYGRKPIYIFANVLHIIGGLMGTFTPNISLYFIAYLFVGCAWTMKMTALCIIVFEITTASWRPFLTCLWTLEDSFFNRMLIILIAYLCQNWRCLFGWATLLSSTGLIASFFIPESPRWYASKQRKDDIVNVLCWGYRLNHWGRKPNETIICSIQYRVSEELSRQNTDEPIKQPIYKLFTDSHMRRVTIFGSFIFCGHILCYYGIFLYAGKMKISVFLTTVINTLSTIPGTFIAMFLYGYFRYRKWPLFGVFIGVIVFSALGLLITVIIKPKTDLWLSLLIGSAMCLMQSAMDMIYTYLMELYPTSFRAKGIGFTGGFARFGGALCGFINALDNTWFHGSSLIIYLATLTIVCISIIFLDDTDGVNLPDVVEIKRKPDPTS